MYFYFCYLLLFNSPHDIEVRCVVNWRGGGFGMSRRAPVACYVSSTCGVAKRSTTISMSHSVRCHGKLTILPQEKMMMAEWCNVPVWNCELFSFCSCLSAISDDDVSYLQEYRVIFDGAVPIDQTSMTFLGNRFKIITFSDQFHCIRC